jgi:hypothetical protein
MSVWRVLIGCLLLVGLVGPATVTAVGATGPDGTTAQPVAAGAQAVATESGAVATELQPVAAHPEPVATEPQPLVAKPRPLATEPLTLTTTLRRTPDRVGEISATVTVDIPDQFTELRLTMPPNVTVIRTEGFTQSADGTYEWTKASDTPSVTYRVEANQRVENGQPGADGQYRFVDTESWAVVRLPPQPNVSGRITTQEEPPVVRETQIAGAGVAGDTMAFLGDYELRTHTAHGQQFRLLIPEAADLRAEPAAIFESLAAASDRLRVGDRDEDIFMIAAPTAEVDWAVRGLQLGDSDFWVRDTERLDTPANNWIHEYVHTRQDYEAARDARWFTEGSATYYGALLTLEQQRIGFDRFQRFIATGEDQPQSTAVLSEPDTWENYANYRKGALIAGGLDRQIRLATAQEASLATIFRALNSHDGSVDANTFAGYIERVAGEQTAREAIGATTTDNLIPMWTADEHATAFGQRPAAFDYRFTGDDPITVTDDDGTRIINGTNVTLSVNDTLAVEMTVENVGGTVGDYTLAFQTNATELTRDGRLDPGETATHRFERRFSEPGVYPVRVGGEGLTVTVEQPGLGGVSLPTDSDIVGDIETPGFGVTSALLAVALVAGLGRRRG